MKKGPLPGVLVCHTKYNFHLDPLWSSLYFPTLFLLFFYPFFHKKFISFNVTPIGHQLERSLPTQGHILRTEST